MRRIARRTSVGVGVLALCGSVLTTAPALAAGTTQQAANRTVLVLAREGASDAAVRSAVARAGGTVVATNAAFGTYIVTTAAAGFSSTVRASGLVAGVTKDRVIGRAPRDQAKRGDLEKVLSDRVSRVAAAVPAATGSDPLAPLQWDMDMIHAPQAHTQPSGTGAGVRVGVIDTGVDGSHPDIAAHFNTALSRNFTVDDPIIDGACADESDGSCTDPADVDENGHGTHVAGTMASPINGTGIVGVAPDAEIVNLRAGQDSGFFLQPTLDALTYAGDNGIDVVNMSYYIDPWLYNCKANPADSAEDQLEQQTVIDATERALRYARQRGVTLVSAAGNENTDLNRPTFDDTSPDYPPDAAYDRTVDNSCLTMPTEGKNVVAVSALGPTGLKADYSNWGTQEITPDGEGFVIKDCTGGTCGYYQYLQGTSMASPHAAGVVALIVGRWGHRDNRRGGLELMASQAENILERTATDHACPAPVYDYPDRGDAYTSNCDGSTDDNGWYGEGVVDAVKAVTTRH